MYGINNKPEVGSAIFFLSNFVFTGAAGVNGVDFNEYVIEWYKDFYARMLQK